MHNYLHEIYTTINIITKTDLFYQTKKGIIYLLKTKICLKQFDFYWVL